MAPLLNTALGAFHHGVRIRKLYLGDKVIIAGKTNQATYPSMEVAAAAVEVRRSLATTPDGRTYVNSQGTTLGWSSSRWFGGGSATGTYTNVTGAVDGPIPGITSYARKTWTNITGGGQGDTGITTNVWTGFVAGAVYTVSGWMRASVDRTAAGWDTQWADATGTVQRTNLAYDSLPAGVWRRFSGAFTAPTTGATNVAFVLDVDGGGTPWAVGSTLDVTGLLLEQAGAVGAVARTNRHTNPAVGRALTNWSAFGAGGTYTLTRETTGGLSVAATWCKTTCTVAATSGSFYLATTGAGTTALPVTAGVTYTSSAFVISSSTTIGLVRIELVWYDAAGATLSTDTTGGTAIAAVGVWERRSKTLVAPASAAFLRVTVVAGTATGIPVGGYVGATAALVEASGTLGGYFDGATVGSVTDEYAWTGVPFTTSSVVRPAAVGALGPYFDGSTRPPLRVNLAASPNATVQGGCGWYSSRWFGGSGGTGTHVRLTGQVDGPPGTGLTSYIRKSWTSVPGTNGNTGFDHGTVLSGAITAGGVYSFSSHLRTSATGKSGAQIKGSWRDSSNATIGSSFSGTGVALPAGVWTRLSVTNMVAPAGAVSVNLISDVDGGTLWAAGDTLDGTGLLVEASSTLNPYFDGSTSQPAGFDAAWYGTVNGSLSYTYDADLTASWTGTAWASPSTLTAPGVQGASGNNDRVSLQSSQWAASGTKSLRITPGKTPTNDTWSDIKGMLPSGASMAGKTYTLLGKIRLTAPLTGTLYPVSRGFRAQATTGGTITFTHSAQAPNLAGVHEVRATFTVPANSTGWDFFRLYNGAAFGGGDVWWDELMLIEGAYTGPYRDGRSPGWGWDGAVDASVSSGWN